MIEIRAILFDADGVFQHPTDDLEARLERALGFVPTELAQFLAEVFEAEGTTLAGERDFDDVLEPLVKKWGAAGTAAALAECWSSIVTDEAILALIARLRRAGYLCALATNQQRRRGTHMADTLGYRNHFDHSFYSWELGFAKPDPRYFLAISRALQLEPAQLLFIDDREANIAAASALGIHTAHFIHDKTDNAVTELVRVLARFGVSCE